MAEHDPQDVEVMARLMVDLLQVPKDQASMPATHKNMRSLGSRMLDALQEKGWKITQGPDDIWQGSRAPMAWHEKQPICPREGEK